MKYLLPMVLLLAPIFGYAQHPNIVVNPGFEQYNSCPVYGVYNLTTLCTNWRMYNGYMVEYYNTCSSWLDQDIPTNCFGYQQTVAGDAYIGIYEHYYNPSSPTDLKAYAAGYMAPMQAGAAYEVTIHVSLSDYSGCATDDLGVFFYDSGPSTVPTSGKLNVAPHVSYSNYGIISDKINWTKLRGFFVADSAYDNIVIGGFPGATPITPLVISTNYHCNYYVDSVLVRLRDTLYIDYRDSMICGTDSFMVPYNAYSGFFHAGNVFTVQLSDANGSFANPINIGSKTDTVSGNIKAGLPATITPGLGYRMRVISSNGVHVSEDNGKNISIGMISPAKPVATSNTPVCSGNTINLYASTTSTGITGWKWKGPNFSAASQNTSLASAQLADSGEYVVTVFKYGCLARDTEFVTIKQSPPAINAISNNPVCATDSIKLNVTNVANVVYGWTGPNSYSSSLQRPVITPASASHSGTYTVTATAGNGCAVSSAVIVTVQPMPAIPSATNNGPVCSGDSLKLFCSTTTAGVTYGWTGPGSYNSTLQNAARANTTVAHSGVYTLTTNLNGCKQSDTTQVTVNLSPAKPVAANSGPVCEGVSFNLSASNLTVGATYSWAGPASYTANTANASRTSTIPAHSGNYIVTANMNGCDRKDTTAVTVKPLPAIPALTSNSPLCPGDSMGLTATSTAGAVYQWTGPGGYTTIQQNPYRLNVNTSYSGSYSVTATLNGCSSSNTTTVLVNPTPATPVATSNSPVCPNTPINLFANNVSGATYNWTGPLSYSAAQQNPAINNATLSQAGTYSVTATVNGCVSQAGTTNVAVATPPATYTAGSNSPVCAGGTLNLSVTNMPGAVFTWSGPNGFAATTQNPSIAPVPLNAGGIYSVYATLNSCQYATVTTNITVNNVSSLGVYPSPNDTLCINNANANFVAVPFNAGTAPQYQWYKNNTLIGGATTISYPATGIADGDSFYCRMTVTGLCADPLVLYSNKVGMTVLPLTVGPTVTITADPGTLLSPWQLVKFTAVATNAGTLPKYQWKRNGQDVIGATSNVWSANNLSNGDTISCVVTSGVWCASPASNTSNRMVVNIKTGISDIDADRKLDLYPNPNNGSFVVYIPLALSRGGHVSADVVDALGRTVYSDRSQPVENRLEIALPASVANGVYMLKLQADGVVYHARFTVSR
ncbi:T9SS type A sorting domain-containing protein [Polluticoccus soli]|uniref:T9SS type A sorting domain-containing protein n=1 Tax=Polluticoccus soli TaxID=3034150 RepID=UPI0023E0C499|nr:T9SS type A sorting domain-containing protein [Flavipsychrobacter sp. JY13-12]